MLLTVGDASLDTIVRLHPVDTIVANGLTLDGAVLDTLGTSGTVRDPSLGPIDALCANLLAFGALGRALGALRTCRTLNPLSGALGTRWTLDALSTLSRTIDPLGTLRTLGTWR